MDARKLRILAAVVDNYIKTGEPVGSKTISMMPDIKVSAATVRNDMAVLEELGLLEQPHTSAGRIPTFSGYRLYIEEILGQRELAQEEKERLDAMLGDENLYTEELLLESASTALAELTKCATVVSNLAPKYSVISKVEVIPTGKRIYVVLLITSNGKIKNKACRMEFDLTQEHMEFLTKFLEENLEGVSVEELSEERLDQLITAMGTYMVALSPLVKGICEMSRDLRKNEVIVTGEQNLLTYGDLDKSEIVRFISHKDELSGLLDDSMSGVQVVFGEEGDEGFAIGNSSMIVSRYQKGGKTAGSLGVIGPVRLDYAKIIPYIDYFTEKLTRFLSGEGEGKEESNDE